jgi:hypothetical protein
VVSLARKQLASRLENLVRSHCAFGYNGHLTPFDAAITEHRQPSRNIVYLPKIAATSCRNKGPRIDITTGAGKSVLRAEFLAAHFLAHLESGWSQSEAVEEANSRNN